MSLTDKKVVISPSKYQRSIRQEYYATLAALAKSGATWFFCAVVLAALLILVFKGRLDVIRGALPWLVGMPVLALLTIPLTMQVYTLPPIQTRCSRTQLWWQTAILLVVILLAIYRGIVYYAPHMLYLPVLYPLARWSIFFLGTGRRPPGNLVAIPVLYLLIPLLLLLLSGARWRELGLGRGYHTWRVTLLWSIVPLLGFIALVVMGQVVSLLQFLQHLLRAMLQGSFFEEFLFRSAFMSRLSYLLRSDWGLVLSALLSGLAYLGLQIHTVRGDWLVGAAATVLSQAMIGLGLAVIYRRTRNLVAGSIFHAILDMFTAFT